MALTLDAESTWVSTTTLSTVTISHTCTGSNRLLVVCTGNTSSDTVSGVTYNGVALVQRVAITSGGNDAQLWSLSEENSAGKPDTGTHDIVVTWSVSANELGACAVSFTGAHQTSVLGAIGSEYNAANATPQAITIASAGDEMVVDVISAQSAADAATATTPQNEIGTSGSQAGGGFFGGASYKAGAASTTMQWDYATGVRNIGHAVAAFKPSAAGGPSAPMFRGS